jgi:SAM-dependent methyltransferase
VRVDLVELLRCPLGGGPLALEVLERDGDEVEVGLLRGEAATWPVLAGIPLLRGGDGEAVDLIRAGDTATATALAVVRRTPLSRLDAVVPLLADLRPARPLARRVAAARDRGVARRTGIVLAAAVGSPDPLLRLTHLDNRRPNPEGYHYFRYRLGLPRHLVALGAVAAARPGPEPVVEVGCGAGHLTPQLQALLAPRRYVAVERDLDLLWVARRFFAPAADHVCADATALPFADRAFGLAVAVDVLSFVEAKAAAARELRRVLGPEGGVVLTSLINAAVRHEYAGWPLPVAGWRRLVEGMPSVALADRTVLDAYLAARAAPGSSDGGEDLEAARTVSLLAGEAALGGAGAGLAGWPHALGRLGPHPLLRRDAGDDESTVLYRRVLPSESFAADNPDLDRYLPERLALTRAAVDQARAAEPGRVPAVLAAAVARVAVLGYPPGWPGDPWGR